MLTLDEARTLLATRVAPLAPVERPLGEAAGCRLADVARAAADLPACSGSAMDGYAVRAADLASGAPLPVTVVVPSGAAPSTLPPGAAARIFTGAALPSGADTVVPQELAESLPGGYVRLAALQGRSHVRPPAEIFPAGAQLAAPGEPLTPVRLATLAAAGLARVRVFPRPRLATVVTGAELVDGSVHATAGQVRDSNGPMLAALASRADLKEACAARVGDELAALTAALVGAAAAADLVVTSGGVSVGDFDLVPRAIAEAGGEVALHGVAIQPGKPVLVARLGDAWLIGLPGNPVSALVAWRMFARPIAEALAGDRAAFAEEAITAPTVGPVENTGDRTQLRPAALTGAGAALRAQALPWKGSHDILAASHANALACVPPRGRVEAGAQLACFPLPWRWGE